MVLPFYPERWHHALPIPMPYVIANIPLMQCPGVLSEKEHAIVFEGIPYKVQPAYDRSPVYEILFPEVPVLRHLLAELEFHAHLQGFPKALFKGRRIRRERSILADPSPDNRVGAVLDAIYDCIAAGTLGNGGEHECGLHLACIADPRRQLNGKLLSWRFLVSSHIVSTLQPMSFSFSDMTQRTPATQFSGGAASGLSLN
jgi:hypothetical protein